MDYPMPSVESISNSLEALSGFLLTTDGESWTLRNKDKKVLWVTAGGDQQENLKRMIVVCMSQVAKKLDSYEEWPYRGATPFCFML